VFHSIHPDALDLSSILHRSTSASPKSSRIRAVLNLAQFKSLLLVSVVIFSTMAYAGQTFPCPLPSVDRTVTICTPVGPAAIESPVRVVAGTRHSQVVTLMQIYVDGKKVFEVAGDQADTNLNLAAGIHSLTVQALDALGFYRTSTQVTVAANLVPRFAYSAATDGTVSGYTIASGTGQPRPNGYAVADSSATDATVSWGRFLFIANGTAGTISAFTVSQAGKLAETQGSPFRCGIDCRGLAVDPSGKFLYVADFGADLIRSYQIDAGTGVLTDFVSYATGSQPHSLVVDPGGRFLYVTNYGDGSVTAFSIIEGRGVLTPLSGSPFKAGANPAGIAMDRTARYVVVSNAGSKSVSTFLVAADGTLRNATGSPLAIVESGAVAIYPSGAFVYVLHPTINRISAYKVQFSSGTLTWVGTYVTGSTPKSLSVDAQGKFLYLVNSGVPADLWTFRINPTSGAISLAYKSRTHGPGMALALSKGTTPVTYTPRFLYVGSVSQDSPTGSVAGFAIGSGGGLTPLAGSPFAHPTGVVALAAHPSGQFLYAPGRQPSYFQALMVDYLINPATGALTVGQVEQWFEPLNTRSMAVDVSGRFAYSPSAGDNEPVLYGWGLDQGSGALTGWLFYGVGGPRYDSVALDPTGKFAYFMGDDGPHVDTIDPRRGDFIAGQRMTLRSFRDTAVDSSGQFVIGIDETTNIVASHKLNGTTGVLTEVSAVTGGTRPYALAIDPYNRFVFVANNASNDVSVFTLNGSTGALTKVAGSPFPAGLNPVAIAVDDSGRYLYVANTGTRDVSAYSINATSGALVPLQPQRVPTGTNGPLTSISTVGATK
jgi:6-phosphogluconolactonase (cycloisomerase 2 family)